MKFNHKNERMIPITDLRIGNITQDGIVDAIHPQGVIETIKDKARHFIDLNLADPIELTPEWMERFGFEKINHIHGYTFYSANRKKNKSLPPISIYENRTECYSYSVNHCQYVHQLQNLIHAITGTDLILNDK